MLHIRDQGALGPWMGVRVAQHLRVRNTLLFHLRLSTAYGNRKGHQTQPRPSGLYTPSEVTGSEWSEREA